MTEETQFEEVGPGDVLLKVGGGDYKEVKAGQPLKAHIARVEKVQGTNWQTKQPEEKLSVSFELDDGEGQGQTYSSWMTKSLHQRSALGKLTTAIYGDGLPVNERNEFDVFKMIGQPVQIFLKKPDKDKDNKQFVDTEKGFLEPTEDQKAALPKVDKLDQDEIEAVFK